RMFQALRQVDADDTLGELRTRVAQGDSHLAPALTVLDNLDQLAFYHDLRHRQPELPARLSDSDHLAPVVHALDTSLLYSSPKALVAFHTDQSEYITPLHEHLIEAAMVAPSAVVRLHFTVSQSHHDAIERTLSRSLPAAQKQLSCQFNVGFSYQKPSTDTPALYADGTLARTDDGRLLFRPGGHGALLHNLPSDADIVLIKNIDNVVSAAHRPPVVQCRRRLLQALLNLESERDSHVVKIRKGDPHATRSARGWLIDLGYPGDDSVKSLMRDLDRPLRVCGMVPNGGDPGGGPFWIQGPEGPTAQIVEGVEVDHDAPDQQAIWRTSTHFNPVDLACCLRGVDGEPLQLDTFVDQTRWFTATKQHRGRALRILERPGLWNGAMSQWLTRFVQMPRYTFQPVKTAADLLKPAHLQR
ncbi:MAG: hypothetical protein ACI9MC_001479, partial [Kiritimatiellia bacterium]